MYEYTLNNRKHTLRHHEFIQGKLKSDKIIYRSNEKYTNFREKVKHFEKIVNYTNQCLVVQKEKNIGKKKPMHHLSKFNSTVI